MSGGWGAARRRGLGAAGGLADFKADSSLLKKFLQLDDFDIWGAIKLWKNSQDYILKNLSRMFLDRNLFKINLRNEEFSQGEIEDEKSKSVLVSDAKERAENIMITDLVRNDLSHTAQKGSVQVTEL